MTERERLIHLLCNVDCNGADRREGGCTFRQDSRCNVIQKLDMCMIENIADHLLANGVIVPPCKVGSTIYMLVTKRPRVYCEPYTMIQKSKVTFGNLERVIQDIGKTVFLTREEAEKALDGKT